MVKYENSCIYKLISDVDDKLYVGATTTMLCKRMAQHRRKSKIWINRPVYKHFNEIGWEHVSIVLIKKYPCRDIDEMHQEERKYIELLGASLNKYIPNRTRKERNATLKYKQYRQKYYQTHNKQIKEWGKIYRKLNKERISEIKRRKVICKCGSIITKGNVSTHLRTKKHKNFIEKELKN